MGETLQLGIVKRLGLENGNVRVPAVPGGDSIYNLMGHHPMHHPITFNYRVFHLKKLDSILCLGGLYSEAVFGENHPLYSGHLTCNVRDKRASWTTFDHRSQEFS